MKKRTKPPLLLLASALLLWPGCAVIEVVEMFALPANHPHQYRDLRRHQQAGDTWRGAHIGALLAAWGKPDGLTLSAKPDQQGWSLYSWLQLHTEEQEGQWVEDDQGLRRYEAGETYVYTCKAIATADPDGVIGEVDFSGECDYFPTPARRPGSGG